MKQDYGLPPAEKIVSARLERWARIVAAANRPDIARELLEEAEQLRQERAA